MIDPPVTEVKFDGPDKAIVDLLPTADHPAFDGHFPHNPILPGVVQIDWALRLAVLHLGSKDGTRDYQVKFQRPIVPNAPVSVELRLDRARDVLDFSYRQQDAIASSGRLRLSGLP